MAETNTTDSEISAGNDTLGELPEQAHAAWQAYSGMLDTKQRHYAFLEVLENKKKKFNLSPSNDDKQKLEGYLSDHSAQVKQFTKLSTELKVDYPEAHQQLFIFIGKLSDGEPSKKTEH